MSLWLYASTSASADCDGPGVSESLAAVHPGLWLLWGPPWGLCESQAPSCAPGMLEGSLLLVCLGAILPVAHSVGLLVVTSHPFFLAAQDAARQFCGSPLTTVSCLVTGFHFGRKLWLEVMNLDGQ